MVRLNYDFIEGLPKSEGCDTILVVVDRYSKYAQFFALKHPFSATTVEQVFLDNVVKLHGTPKSLVSDRDKKFTSHFWRSLFQSLNTKLALTTAYHPQSDGKSERVNQCLEMYLRCVIHDCPAK
jgi:transposase InsO family protein